MSAAVSYQPDGMGNLVSFTKLTRILYMNEESSHYETFELARFVFLIPFFEVKLPLNSG